MIDAAAIRERFLALSAHLDERGRRIFAATEARTAGYGGIAAVSRVTGVAASAIGRGLAELSATDRLAPDRVRRPGGGGKRVVNKDPTLLAPARHDEGATVNLYAGWYHPRSPLQ